MTAKLDEFLLEHSDQLQSLESLVHTLTYILPGRFNDAEFASESLYSLLNLLGLYRDRIACKRQSVSAQNLKRRLDFIAAESTFNRYILWTHRNPRVRVRSSSVCVVGGGGD